MNNWKPDFEPPIAEYMFYKRKALYGLQGSVAVILTIMFFPGIMFLERYICFNLLGVDSNTYFLICQLPLAASVLGVGFGVYNLLTYIWTFLMMKKYGGDIFKDVDQYWLLKEFGHDSKAFSDAIFRALCYRKFAAMSLVLTLPFTINQGWTMPIFITFVVFIIYFAYRKKFFMKEFKEMNNNEK